MKAIKTLRTYIGMTAKQLAVELGYASIDTVFKKESGSRALSDSDAFILEKLSGVSWAAWKHPDKFFNPFASGTSEDIKMAMINIGKQSIAGSTPHE